VHQGIAKIRKNQLEHIVVELTEFNGHDLVGLRVYRFVDGKNERIPTTKGITVSVRLLPEIRAALAEAEKQARAAGLLG